MDPFCSKYTNYKYYTADPYSTGGFNLTGCDVSLTNPPKLCLLQIVIRYKTFIVTTMRGTRKLAMQQMLIDEGGIVGGVMFVTWFFSIFTLR